MEELMNPSIENSIEFDDDLSGQDLSDEALDRPNEAAASWSKGCSACRRLEGDT